MLPPNGSAQVYQQKIDLYTNELFTRLIATLPMNLTLSNQNENVRGQRASTEVGQYSFQRRGSNSNTTKTQNTGDPNLRPWLLYS